MLVVSRTMMMTTTTMMMMNDIYQQPPRPLPENIARRIRIVNNFMGWLFDKFPKKRIRRKKKKSRGRERKNQPTTTGVVYYICRIPFYVLSTGGVEKNERLVGEREEKISRQSG